jgi:hypothetical protein
MCIVRASDEKVWDKVAGGGVGGGDVAGDTGCRPYR